MSLIVGTNSWTTVSEADTYLTNKLYATDWFSLNTSPANPWEVSKESLLISAFNFLIGSSQVTIPVSSTDSNVKNAQVETAWYLFKNYDEIISRSTTIHTGVTSFGLSKRSENLEIKNLGLPFEILGMLKLYNTQNTTALLLGEYDV